MGQYQADAQEGCEALGSDCWMERMRPLCVCLCCILLMTIVKCIFLFSNVSSKIINFETAAQVLFKLYRFKGLGGSIR
jgi:hypothetical protein